MPITSERQGRLSEPMTRMYPRIIGGQCEFCGVMDNQQPSHVQYRICPHFKAMGELMCTYCPENADPVEITNRASLKIHESPTNPNQVIVVCDSYNCSQAHLKRFKRNI